MLNLRPFQIVLLAFFGVAALVSLIFFSMFHNSAVSKSGTYGDKVVIWGTLDAAPIDKVMRTITQSDHDFKVVQYVQKDPRTFELDFLNAIAEGNPPDLVILSSDDLVRYRNKIRPFSSDTISARTVKDTYIDGASIYLLSDGLYGIPFAVDPLVMYWNKDMFSGAGFAQPPMTWNTLLTQTTPALTVFNTTDHTLRQSAVGLGEYSNITHAKDILSMLFLQSGSDIVSEDSNGTYSISLLDKTPTSSIRPADAAVSFYTQFANPTSPNDTWSRALPNDRFQFIGGYLGLYFGLGSEYNGIKNQNPNLNFDITTIPQDSSATIKRDYGTFYAFSIPRTATRNAPGAYNAAMVLANAANSTALDEQLNLTPVDRSVLSAGTSDPYRAVLYREALIAHAWLDPNPTSSENVFQQLIEDVTSGRLRVTEAVTNMSKRLELLFTQS